MEVSQKTKTRTAIWLGKSILGIYQKKLKIWKYACTPMFIAIFIIDKICKQPENPSTDECMKTMSHTQSHTHVLGFFTQPLKKKNAILPFATA